MSSIGTKNKLEGKEIFKISRFKELIKKTKPHKHEGYYELIFIQEGEGFHWIETENFQIKTPDLYFLKPGQLHYWQFTAIPKGFVMMFKEEFFDPVEEGKLFQLIKQLPDITRIPLIEESENLASILEEIFSNYKAPNEYTEEIILGYLRVLLGKIALNTKKRKSENGLTDHLCNKFLNLLAKESPKLHQVNQYAELLNTSPQNLNLSCKKTTGKSASVHISDQLILEAKRNILHTDQNINEIADLLHFNDASYFVKFFKKHTGETPHQFRGRYFG